MLKAIATVAGLAEKWITGRTRQEKIEAELSHKRVSELAVTRRALIRRSTQQLRFFSLSLLMAPLVAPALPWISIADVAQYFDQVAAAVPPWWIEALRNALGVIWVGAEARNLRAQSDELELAKRQEDRETAEAAAGKGRAAQPGSLP